MNPKRVFATARVGLGVRSTEMLLERIAGKLGKPKDSAYGTTAVGARIMRFHAHGARLASALPSVELTHSTRTETPRQAREVETTPV